MELADARIVAEGLQFPEGPVALDDGSVLVVELERGTVTRVLPDGGTEVVAEPGGGPNGLAIGPDGMAYLCNNGGLRGQEPGRIERIDLRTGDVEVILESVEGKALRAPNDIVFDETGGFWFTDHGRASGGQVAYGSIYYVPPGLGEAHEAVSRVEGPNGIGLAPDGSWLVWAETRTRRVIRRPLAGPGQLAPTTGYDVFTLLRGHQVDPDVMVLGLPGTRYLDSLAVDSEGYVAVGSLVDSGITIVTPSGEESLSTLPPECADGMVTNICFGGPDLRTAWLTLSQTGRLATCRWPRPGLALAFPAPWPPAPAS